MRKKCFNTKIFQHNSINKINCEQNIIITYIYFPYLSIEICEKYRIEETFSIRFQYRSNLLSEQNREAGEVVRVRVYGFSFTASRNYAVCWKRF